MKTRNEECKKREKLRNRDTNREDENRKERKKG